jgi:hypothetical protein
VTIHSQWVVTPGKQTNKQTDLSVRGLLPLQKLPITGAFSITETSHFWNCSYNLNFPPPELLL